MEPVKQFAGSVCAVLRLQVVMLSRLYESAPAYVTEQPAFLNAALLALTPLAPLELLAALKTIEVGSPHSV